MMVSVFQQVSPVSVNSKTSINGCSRRGGVEVLPPILDSTSDPPPLFDGTTRLYINDMCPYAQRVWIVRNYKDLYDKMKLVPIDDLRNRPAWYREKVYPENKVSVLDGAAAEFDYLETGLHKFEDGPFFLGQFSQVDVVCAPFVERFKVTFQVIFKHDFMAGRPKLAAWNEAINKIDAYKPRKCDPERLVTYMKKRYLGEG